MVLKVSNVYPEYMQYAQQKFAPVMGEQSVFNSFQKDIDNLETGFKKHSTAYQAGLYAMSPIPTARRLGSLPDSVKEENWPRSGLLLGLAAMNLARDTEEVKYAFKEIKGNAPMGKMFSNAGTTFKKALNNPMNPYQRPQTILKGTFLNALYKKYKWAQNIDKTIDSTNFGKSLMNFLNIKKPEKIKIESLEKLTKGVEAYKFEGNYFKKLFARALTRTPIIGIALTSVLEVPAIVKSAKQGKTFSEKKKSVGKQLLKSAAYVGLITAGIAVGGAAFAAGGTLMALVGMGVGSSLAIAASKQVNKGIDKVIT